MLKWKRYDELPTKEEIEYNGKEIIYGWQDVYGNVFYTLGYTTDFKNYPNFLEKNNDEIFCWAYINFPPVSKLI